MDLPGQLFALGENLGNLARLGVADEVAPVPPVEESRNVATAAGQSGDEGSARGCSRVRGRSAGTAATARAPAASSAQVRVSAPPPSWTNEKARRSESVWAWCSKTVCDRETAIAESYRASRLTPSLLIFPM